MKPSLTCAEQVDLLISRGLRIDRPSEAVALLEAVGYYRLSGYARYFQKAPHHGDDAFLEGASFDHIAKIYDADEALRTLLVPALARTEIMLRAHVSRVISDEYSPYGQYLEDGFYTDTPGREPTAEAVRRDVARSKDRHILKYRNALADDVGPVTLPIWSAVEAWSFGTLSKVIERGGRGGIADMVATRIGVVKAGFAYRIRSLVYLRNRCAHHSRLWNHSVLDAGPTPNNVRTKAKRLAGQFEPRSIMDVIASLDDIRVRSDVGAALLPELVNPDSPIAPLVEGLTHPKNPRDHAGKP